MSEFPQSHPSPSLPHTVLLAMLALLVMTGTRITISLYALSIGLSTFQIGSLIAMFSLLPMFLAVSAGRWLDRVGVAKPLTWGALAIFLGTLLASWDGFYWRLYPVASLVGMGFMLVLVVTQNIVGHLGPPEQRTNRFSMLALVLSVSAMVAPVLAGVMIDHFRHHITFMLFAGFGLLLLGYTRLPRFRQRPEPRQNTHIAQGSALALFWQNPTLRAVYLINILLASAWDLFMFSTPIQGHAHGFSASTIGLVMGSFSLATFVIRFLMPMLSRHFSSWRILGGALVIDCIGYFLIPFQQQAWSMVVLAFALGLAMGASQPNMLNLLFSLAPKGRAGEVIGIRVTIGNACQVVIPLIFGALSSGLGLLPVFLLMSVLLAGGVALVWRVSRHA